MPVIMFKIETERLIITEFTPEMAGDVHVNSLDEDNRRFMPDEVFETVAEAKETVAFLITCYDVKGGPFVYPVLLKETGDNLGYVQFVPYEAGWEIGYHIAKRYTGNGYATEAVRAFLPVMMDKLRIDKVYGVCVTENVASRRVMENNGFELFYEGIGMYQGDEREISKYIFSV